MRRPAPREGQLLTPSPTSSPRPRGAPACEILTHARVLCGTAGEYQESQQNVIKFPEISAPVLEKVVQYFYYKLRYTGTTGHLPEFKIEPEFALELLMAANYLDA